ncbi:hypothetical protein OUZ56_002097 [Daphnia magna]|uniref:Uncharacterized protein n=1 Tax=Daphnia magna TaxID=35525 RepID=A0ABR0A4N3_9CRUS|nr:hypothetical protein OUZ56_002097 [Daphnia magna]
MARWINGTLENRWRKELRVQYKRARRQTLSEKSYIDVAIISPYTSASSLPPGRIYNSGSSCLEEIEELSAIPKQDQYYTTYTQQQGWS